MAKQFRFVVRLQWDTLVLYSRCADSPNDRPSWVLERAQASEYTQQESGKVYQAMKPIMDAVGGTVVALRVGVPDGR